MTFGEKLKKIRTDRGLTQDELAERLFVSRTAVSKWESGRGLPNIESLKAISKLFSLSVDELLSGEELITLAQEDQREKEQRIKGMIFGLLDCGMALLCFLPLFAKESAGKVSAVSLLEFSVAPYLKVFYITAVIAVVLFGVFTLATENALSHKWARRINTASLIAGAVAVFLFTVGRQPYATVFAFAFFIIKAFLLIKRR